MKSHETMPRRSLGKTGVNLSAVGFGGMILVGAPQAAANNYVAEAVDGGINYFDVAPQYGDGEAEEKMGPALAPHRSNIFLACKSLERTRAGCQRELERSLRRLRTDHFDLYQLHALLDVEQDVEVALGGGGAIEAVLEARGKGDVRFIGFSAHSPAAALRAMESGLFDTILYPINFTCHFRSEFDQRPVEEARRRGMGVLALKAMARTRWPKGMAADERPYRNTWYEPIDDPALAALALRWTLSQGATAAIAPGSIDLLRIAMRVERKEEPLTRAEMAQLEALATELQPIFPAG